MTNHTFLARSDVWLGWTLAALLAATAIPGTAFGAERMVLSEESSSTG